MVGKRAFSFFLHLSVHLYKRNSGERRGLAEVMSFDVRVLMLDMRRKLQISLIYKFSVNLPVFIPTCNFSPFLYVSSLRLEPHSDSVLRNTSHPLMCVLGGGGVWRGGEGEAVWFCHLASPSTSKRTRAISISVTGLKGIPVVLFIMVTSSLRGSN